MLFKSLFDSSGSKDYLPAGIRFLKQSRRMFYREGWPMNSMTARLESVRALICDAKIERIIETGTYLAATTRWFAGLGMPVETIEINPYLAARNRRLLRKWKQVCVHTGNSTEVLKHIIAQQPDFNERVFFYLDAHWNDYLPLRDEMQLVLDHYRRAVVLIDDFRVPHDAGYGYDNYGPDKCIELDYLRPALHSGVQCFFPTVSAAEETGARRGYAYFSNDLELTASLEKQSLLQRYPETFGAAECSKQAA